MGLKGCPLCGGSNLRAYHTSVTRRDAGYSDELTRRGVVKCSDCKTSHSVLISSPIPEGSDKAALKELTASVGTVAKELAIREWNVRNGLACRNLRTGSEPYEFECDVCGRVDEWYEFPTKPGEHCRDCGAILSEEEGGNHE